MKYLASFDGFCFKGIFFVFCSLEGFHRPISQNNSGTIDFQEFVQYMRSLDAFRKRAKEFDAKVMKRERSESD